MINSIDLVLGVFIIFYLLKNFGGPLKMVKNTLMIVLFLFIYAIISALIMSYNWPDDVQKTYEESYVTKFSVVLVQWLYPAVERSAPRVDSFVKEKILTKTKPDKELPELKINRMSLPTSLLTREVLPRLQKP